MVVPFGDARDLHLGAALEVAPASQADVGVWVEKVFSEMKPKAVIAAERLGPAANGFLHNLTAQAYGGPETTITYDVVDISGLVTRATADKVLTIGTGDHGNEIGFGGIQETVANVMQYLSNFLSYEKKNFDQFLATIVLLVDIEERYLAKHQLSNIFSC